LKHSTAFRAITALWVLLSISNASPGQSPPDNPSRKSVKLPNGVLQVDWDALLPANAQRQPTVAPKPIHDYLGEAGPAAKQSGSSAVNNELEGVTLRIPGFIVPLDADASGQVVEFLLVPYYGACIHVPPPPPNQIIYVRPVKPFPVKDPFNAYWITGRMHIEIRATQMASASYSMSASQVEAYE